MPTSRAHRSFAPEITQALLEWLGAPALDREAMVRAARVELASARLHEAVLRELLDELPPGQPSPQLRDDLAAAEARVVESARILLSLRAAAHAAGFAM